MAEITGAELARRMDLSPGRITQLLKRGLPRLENGRYDEDEALAWFAARPGHNKQDRARGAEIAHEFMRQKVRATSAKADLDERRGALLDGSTVKAETVENETRALLSTVVNGAAQWVARARTGPDRQQRQDLADACLEYVKREIEVLAARIESGDDAREEPAPDARRLGG